ncbi:hypothetical protein ACSSS7_005169 [Eimeria intestinalis]
MATPVSVALRSCAYAKMVLHATKHPQDPVCGLLIGSVEINDLSSEQKNVFCQDAVPLLHTHMLHPQLRLGVELVESLCSHKDGEKNKHQIVGFYHVDVLASPQKSVAINKEAAQIAKILQQHYRHLLLCTVNQQQLQQQQQLEQQLLLQQQQQLEQQVLLQHLIFADSQKGSSPLNVADDAIICTEAAIQLAEKAVADAAYLDLVDLDDHLSDPKQSPLNPSLLSRFESLIAEDAKRLEDVSLRQS